MLGLRNINAMNNRTAFTLIELLVVVAIIAVLLAILTPAMDQAIYQAELAVCGANLKAAGSGVLTYAMDHRRSFPPRYGTHSGGGFADNGWQPQEMQRGGLDERPLIKDYVSLNNHLNCPLTRKLDIEAAVGDAWLLTAYSMWWNWRFVATGGEGTMSRIGTKFGWSDTLGRNQFDVLISDADMIYEQNGWGHGTHPDRGVNRWTQIFHQDVATAAVPHAPGAPPDLHLTLTRWQGAEGAGADRGLYDMNFAYQDGSVLRYADIAWDAKFNDDRMAGVPYTSGFPSADPLWVHLPRR